MQGTYDVYLPINIVSPCAAFSKMANIRYVKEGSRWGEECSDDEVNLSICALLSLVSYIGLPLASSFSFSSLCIYLCLSISLCFSLSFFSLLHSIYSSIFPHISLPYPYPYHLLSLPFPFSLLLSPFPLHPFSFSLCSLMQFPRNYIYSKQA